jgi:nicotinamidase-related amidase
MASIRGGNQPALVVVDVQVGVLRNCWDVPRVVDRVARALERAREQGVPVIWVQHADHQLVTGSPDWQLHPGLAPAAGEAIVHKQFESAFENTSLEGELAGQGISHVVLAGAMSNWCIRATAYAALERGYDLTLVRDAHTTATAELEDGDTIEAEAVVKDLNLVMRWLSYPGRKTTTATAEEVSFAAA